MSDQGIRPNALPPPVPCALVCPSVTSCSSPPAYLLLADTSVAFKLRRHPLQDTLPKPWLGQGPCLCAPITPGLISFLSHTIFRNEMFLWFFQPLHCSPSRLRARLICVFAVPMLSPSVPLGNVGMDWSKNSLKGTLLLTVLWTWSLYVYYKEKAENMGDAIVDWGDRKKSLNHWALAADLNGSGTRNDSVITEIRSDYDESSKDQAGVRGPDSALE